MDDISTYLMLALTDTSREYDRVTILHIEGKLLMDLSSRRIHIHERDYNDIMNNMSPELRQNDLSTDIFHFYTCNRYE